MKPLGLPVPLPLEPAADGELVTLCISKCPEKEDAWNLPMYFIKRYVHLHAVI
jgi:hypothetical protein